MNETAPLTLIWFTIVGGIFTIQEQFSNDNSLIKTGLNIDRGQ
jgi:hypothetical protein